MLKVFKLFSQNKKTLFFVVGLGLILTFFSWQYLEAGPIVIGPDGTEYDLCTGCGPWPNEWPNCLLCFVQYIASLPVRLIFAVIVGIIGLLALVAGLFYAVTATIVNWLIGIIMSVGVIPGNPLTPKIVEIGWSFSRDFANLFFILALAFIGLATVLRIKEYEMKKALPVLIIIALLINFTPVIVGFVVDMGNIVTKFFLNHAGSVDTLKDTLNMAIGYLGNSLARLFLEDGHFYQNFPEIILKFLFITVYGVVLLVFFALATFIYLLIGAVFFFRTVLLWVLMILSPIAFLSKVFPDSKTTKMVFPDILHWDKWWEKLIQWTVIGIPISFFLFLSNLVMSATYRAEIEGIYNTTSLGVILGNTASSTFSYTSTSTEFINELSGLQVGFVNLFVSLLAPTIAIVLLAMGALISFKAVPEGAKGIMKFTTEKGMARAWPQRGLVGGTTAGIEAIRNIRQTYQEQRGLGVTRGQAFIRTAATPVRAFWQKKPTTPSTPSETPTPSTIPTIPTTPVGVGQANEIEAKTEEMGIQEEATGEEFIAPTPTAPTVTRRQKAHRVIVAPAKIWWRATKASPKIGLRAAIGILKATEDIAKTQIEKEMRIGKIGEKEKEKKEREKKNCPNCYKEIKADAKFCPECGQSLS